jgi:hypothetical protein
MLDESKLVFIVSQPRAGSTLLQAVLSNHSEVDTISEHWMLLQFASFLKPSLLDGKFDRVTCQDAFEDFLRKKGLENNFKLDIKSLLLKYYSEIQTNESNLVLDKTPRYYELLPEIFGLFPKAKIILLIRDPLSSFASMMKTWGRFDYHSLCLHHRRDIMYAPFMIHDFHKRHSEDNRVKKITYESLLSSPEKVIENLCFWLNIDYNPTMLKYGNNDKFRGKYGDQIGVCKYNSLQPSPKNQSEEEEKSRLFTKLLKGYAHCLGASFLKEYGNYDSPKAKPSFAFAFFKFYCQHFSIFEKYNFSTLLSIFIKYSIFKVGRIVTRQ